MSADLPDMPLLPASSVPCSECDGKMQLFYIVDNGSIIGVARKCVECGEVVEL